MPDTSSEDRPATAGADDDTFHNEAEWVRTGFAQRNQPAPFDPARAPTSPEDSRFLFDWVDMHRLSPHPPDPAFPNGAAFDLALDALRACRLELPYPAARCGMWVVTCKACGYATALATGGRADDPRSVRMPCKLH
jgi:hypothetical protein